MKLTDPAAVVSGAANMKAYTIIYSSVDRAKVEEARAFLRDNGLNPDQPPESMVLARIFREQPPLPLAEREGVVVPPATQLPADDPGQSN